MSPAHTALVEEARRLDAGATPGPWDDVISTTYVRSLGKQDVGTYVAAVCPAERGDPERPHPGNKEFIARSRSLLPALADVVEEQDRDYETLRRMHKQLVDLNVERQGEIQRLARERDELRAAVEQAGKALAYVTDHPHAALGMGDRPHADRLEMNRLASLAAESCTAALDRAGTP